MALQEGQNLGPYRVLTQLGQGGMATVYKGYHPKLDRHVAIKAIHQAFLEDPAFLSRFEREAQIVAKLDHPHIVPVYDYAEQDGQPYLVMKHIEGQTLKALLFKGPLPLEQITEYMNDIAEALDYAHKHGVLHRDIKPSNIIIDESGAVYLTDFGLARLAQSGESTMSQDMLIGTPHYISPEQAIGRKALDTRSDVYSLGVVLYELLVGRVPFSADTPYAVIHDHIYRPLPLPSKVNPEITAEVEQVLLKALAKDPVDRYDSAKAMIDAFKAAAKSSGMTALNPDRVNSATVLLAREREEETGTASDKIPSPLPEQKRKNQDGQVEWRLDLATAGQQIKQAFENWSSEGGHAIEEESVRHRLEATVGPQIKEAMSNWQDSPWNPKHWAGEGVPASEEDSIRRRVEQSYKKRTEFFTHFAIYAVINIMLWLIWTFGSGAIASFAELGAIPSAALAFPWPLIVTLGWGSGMLAHAVETFLETGERAAKRDRAVRSALRADYGENWMQTISKTDYNRTRHRILRPYDKRKEFFEHVAVYIMINIMLWAIWAGSQGIGAVLDGVPAAALGFPWPLIVMLGWGAGIVGHFVDMVAHHGLNPNARERAVQRELERERALLDEETISYAKPKRDPSVRLNEDGELTDSVVEAWDIDKPKRERGAR